VLHKPILCRCVEPVSALAASGGGQFNFIPEASSRRLRVFSSGARACPEPVEGELVEHSFLLTHYPVSTRLPAMLQMI